MKSHREWRIERLLSIQSLAEQAGVAPSTIVDIESGKRLPTLKTMRKLSAALDVPASEVSEFVVSMGESLKDAA